MTQLKPTFGEPIADLAARRRPGLPARPSRPGLPVQTVSCGVPFLLVPLAHAAAVDDASLDAPALRRLRERAGLDEPAVFLFSTEPGRDKATAYSRMFAPGFGIGEDPATGSASGPLGCYLVRHRVVPPEKAGAMRSLQGVKMGRPSHIHISIGLQSGEITACGSAAKLCWRAKARSISVI